MGKIYKHIGYYNDVNDIKELFSMSADGIIEIMNKVGNFVKTIREIETDIDFDTLHHEHDFNMFQQTTDEKYLVRYQRGDNKYNDWFIDVYKLIEDTDTITEYCPHCDCEVELENEFKVQKCPECGMYIVPCNLCPLLAQNICNNGKCPLEALANELNENDDKEMISRTLYTLIEFTEMFNNSEIEHKKEGFEFSFTDDDGIKQELCIYFEEKIQQTILYHEKFGCSAFTWKSDTINGIPLKDALWEICCFVPEKVFLD